uniref:Amiloride-sensitive sodium channel n=1 Tax=Anopheles culicifacies TaxID=139723 RepID=A0A182M0Y1_9DIPT
MNSKSPLASGRKRVEKNIGQRDTSGPLGWLLRLFKSISTFVLIFLEQGAVHGLAHLGKPFLHILENFVSWERYQSKSTVVAIEKDHYYWNTSMPSLTICPLKRIYRPYLVNFCSKNGISKEEDQDELFNFLESLANSSYFNFGNIKHSDNVDSMLDMLQIKPENYMNIIYNLTRDLTRLADTELRVRTQSNLEFLRTYQTLTEYGICYTTNSFISSNLTASPYETLNIAKYQPLTNEAHEYETFSIEIVTTKDFKEDTTISQRGCRFHYESNLTHYSIYTKGICLQECRIQLAEKLCGCIPHFYPNPDGPRAKKVCHYRQLMKCFPRYQKLFLEFKQDNNDKKGIPCYCEQNCVDSKVIIEHRQVLKQTQKLIGSIGGLIVVKRYPLVRFSRQLLFTFTDLLVVSIGGTAGFFLGFSVLGMVEILYFFTLRLVWYIAGRR